ncbi:MAG: hypothetical protein WAO20_01705 [Acidobacteriota bacterium]
MATRTKTGQRTHDSEVRRQAQALEEQGFTVSADLPGWTKPPIIDGHIPDVYAEKGKLKKIREVETPDSVRQDADQRKSFRNWANRSDNRTAQTVVTGKKK